MRVWGFLILAAVAFAAVADSHLSTDAEVNAARELIQRAEYGTALTILRPLVAGLRAHQSRADFTDMRFLLGIAAIAQAQQTEGAAAKQLLTEAVAALRAILIDRPGLIRVRLELARAFFLARDDGLAEKHFRRVLAGKPHAAIRANINQFLVAIAKRDKWSGYLQVRVEENDNVNQGPTTDTITIFGLPLALNAESKPQTATSIGIFAGTAYTAKVGEKWRWVSGVDIARVEFERREFDQTIARVRSGPKYLPSARSEVSLQGIGGQRYVARERVATENGLQVTAARRANEKLRWTYRGQRLHIRHDNATNQTETAHNIGGEYLFSPVVRGRFTLGVNSVREDGRHHQRERTADVELSKLFARGWTCGGGVRFARTKHAESVLLSDEKRVDRDRAHRLFCLNRKLTLMGFSPQLTITRDEQNSNADLHTYRRTRAGLTMVRQF